jgi:CRP-like cAMP-binding protein
MDALPIRKLEQAAPLTQDERRALIPLLQEELSFKARTDIAVEGDHPAFSTVLLEGWAWRYRMMADGRRQILSIQIPGDWTDLHSYFIRTMDHSVAAVTDCRVAKIPHGKIRDLIEQHPRFAQILWRDTALEAAMHREWIVDLGARRSEERLAHFLCELRVRLDGVGLAQGEGFPFPFTQEAVGDIIGVSTVHANRVVQAMAEEGLAKFGRGVCTVTDWSKLRSAAGFDQTYLHIDEGPPVDGPLAGSS